MDIVQGDEYRVRGNWLFFPNLPLDPIQIPFGFAIDRVIDGKAPSKGPRQLRPRLRLENRDRQVLRLDVEAYGTWRPVLPAFSRNVTGNGSATIRVELAILDWQRGTARALVARTHYLAPRGGGVILLARILDHRTANELRAEWWKQQSREARIRMGGSVELAAGGLSDVVGALHLERLMHGHPAGRSAIYKQEGRPVPRVPNGKRGEGFRRRVVHDLGLYWISRVAVDYPFQGRGVGSALCDAAREITARWMLEPGKNVELIRRMHISKFEELKAGGGDFLIGRSKTFAHQLPFGMYTPYLSRVPGQVWNQAKGRSELVLPSVEKRRPGGDCLVYYHAKAGPMVLSSASHHRTTDKTP